MAKHKEQRVGIFIDVQNLYHSAKHLFQARVNYKELMKGLVAGRKLVRAIGYVVKTESTTGEESFFEALVKAGVELRMKDIQIFPGGAKKADWDVGMAVDAIRMADFLDTVILVTGDGDFLPLVEYLRWGKGRTVEVASFTRSSSSRLKEEADAFINLEEIPGIMLSSKRAVEQGRRLRTSRFRRRTPAGEAAAASAFDESFAERTPESDEMPNTAAPDTSEEHE